MNAPIAYLETEVTTACPPKLRLMLLEAALRLARRSFSLNDKPLPEEQCRVFASLRKILLHLLASLEQKDDEMTRNIKSVYFYLFCAVAETELEGHTHKIRDVEQVLEIECETWRTLTQRYLDEVVQSQTPRCTSDATACEREIPSFTDALSNPSRSDVVLDCVA
jgi:flagellar biosynthetic protein FliS